MKVITQQGKENSYGEEKEGGRTAVKKRKKKKKSHGVSLTESLPAGGLPVVLCYCSRA